jgi:hypothetical protein
MDYNKSQKGQKGFIKKYKSLGELKQIRVPVSLEPGIKRTLELLEAIAQKENSMETVNGIMENLIIGLVKTLNKNKSVTTHQKT